MQFHQRILTLWRDGKARPDVDKHLLGFGIGALQTSPASAESLAELLEKVPLDRVIACNEIFIALSKLLQITQSGKRQSASAGL
jgi:hypothetical protein